MNSWEINEPIGLNNNDASTFWREDIVSNFLFPQFNMSVYSRAEIENIYKLFIKKHEQERINIYRLIEIIQVLKEEFGIFVVPVLWEDTTPEVELQWRKILVNISDRSLLGMIFTISHVFGHYVQLQHKEDNKDLLLYANQKPPIILSQDFQEKFRLYEKEAFEIGKWLMIKAFWSTDEIDQAYEIFFQEDFTHYMDYLAWKVSWDILTFNKYLSHRLIEYKDAVPITIEAIVIHKDDISEDYAWGVVSVV